MAEEDRFPKRPRREPARFQPGQRPPSADKTIEDHAAAPAAAAIRDAQQLAAARLPLDQLHKHELEVRLAWLNRAW